MIFTKEQDLFRQTVREFAEQEVAPLVPEIIKTGMVPKSLWLKAGQVGIPAVNIPKRFGGLGLGQIETCIMFEEICRVSPGFGLSIELTIVSNNIFRQSEYLAKKYLPALVEGKTSLVGAATPPEGQPNGFEHKPFLKKVDGGYIGNGTRLYATNAVDANIIYVVGASEYGSVHAAIIEADWDGVTRGPLDRKIGQAGNMGGTLTFQDVFIPTENVTDMAVGTSETYYTVYGGCAAQALGCARGMLEQTIERALIGSGQTQPLAEMTGVHYKLAELQSKVLMCDSMVYDLAAMQDECQRTSDEALQLKWYALAEATKIRVPEMLVEVTKECMKLNGRTGYHDSLSWRYVGDSLNYCHMDITTEIHLQYLAGLMGITPQT